MTRPDHEPSLMQPGRGAVRVVFLLFCAEILSMTGFGTYPALLALLRDAWHLNNSEAGLIGGVFFAGYMAAVPVLASFTDRVDARRVYILSTGISAAGAFGFALFAHGLWSAVLFQTLVGAGLAGTYMPGLKILTDHLGGPRQSRYIAIYTSTFGLGTSVSLLLAGLLEPLAGWQWTFAAAGIGPIIAGLVVYLGLPARKQQNSQDPRPHLLDFRPVLRNRAALTYIVGYSAHCWELFGLRSWMVAFLIFSFSMGGHAAGLMGSAAVIAAAVNLLGQPASIIGNELAVRHGRRRAIMTCMALSTVLACLVGFTASSPWWVVVGLLTVYFLLVMGDSASLTAGLIAASVPSQRGMTMALHSFLGFGAGFVAPLVFGVVLDLAGGAGSAIAWGLGFSTLALGYAASLTAFALMGSSRHDAV